MIIDLSPEGCEENVNAIKELYNHIKMNNLGREFIEALEHGIKCVELNCEPICEFINRLFFHGLNHGNNCETFREYEKLFNMHVLICENDDCEIVICANRNKDKKRMQG